LPPYLKYLYVRRGCDLVKINDIPIFLEETNCKDLLDRVKNMREEIFRMFDEYKSKSSLASIIEEKYTICKIISFKYGKNFEDKTCEKLYDMWKISRGIN
jgi:hypothetical protein